MKFLNLRFGALIASIALVTVIVACGGGGDGGSTVITATPVATNPLSVAAPQALNENSSAPAKEFAAKVMLTSTGTSPYGNVAPLDAVEQLLNYGENALPQFFPGHKVTGVYGKFHYRYYPQIAPGMDVYLAVAMNVTPSDGLTEGGVYVLVTGGPLTYVGLVINYIVPAANWPAVFSPMGEKVFGANQLPAGCTSWSQQCWKNAVANGTVKFVATSATMTGLNNRPVVFAYFRNTSCAFNACGLWNVLAMYADDGTLVGPDIFGGNADEIDMVYGNSKGVIYRLKNTTTCYQIAWDAQPKSWDVNGIGGGGTIACP